MQTLPKAGLSRHRKTLPEFGLPLCDWKAPCFPSSPSQNPLTLPAERLRRKFGLSPSHASLIAFHAGYKTNSLEATHV